jgi:hypothetical protein
MAVNKRYVVVMDTLGCGLELLPEGLDIYDGEDELKEAVLLAADHILCEDGFELHEYKDYELSGLTLSQQIVILELVDTSSVTKSNQYVYDAINSEIEKTNNDDYEQYLKLKERFEGTNK